MTSDPATTVDRAGELSPVFLGAILGAVSCRNGDAATAFLADRGRAAAAAALGGVLARPVELTAGASDDLSPAAACVLTLPGISGEVTFLLDEPAARAMVCPLLTDHLGVSAAGPLLEAERGVLEYALTAWAGALGDGAIVRRFAYALGEADLSCGMRVDGRLAVPPYEGRVALLAPRDSDPARLAAWAARDSGVVDERWLSAVCTLRVAVARVDATQMDFATAQPGDVVLCGRTSLEHLSAEPTLCSDAGWTIGRVRIRHDSPATLSVELLNVDPWPESRTWPPDVLAVLAGRLELTGAQLRTLRAGVVLDLRNDAQAGPVLLRAGGRAVARGEFVTACGEVGVRITALEATP